MEPEYTLHPKPIKDIARLAAKWWADLLRSDITPSLVKDAGYASDGPESHLRGMMGDGLIALIREKQPKVTAEMCQVFEDELTKLVLNGIDNRDPEWRERNMQGRINGLLECGGFHLEVDYDPCWPLYIAAKRAGLSDGGMYRFPYKTRMYVEGAAVSVAQGYGANREYLWATVTTLWTAPR